MLGDGSTRGATLESSLAKVLHCSGKCKYAHVENVSWTERICFGIMEYRIAGKFGKH